MDSSAFRLDDERTRQVRALAGEFTLSLVKALLQTGWYSPEHPMARTAAQEVIRQFRALSEGEKDITYVLLSSVDERGVMIDGLLPEPIEVAKALRGILGDHFIAKFHDYFVRNNIASFTIKHSITDEEFIKFLDLWVTWAAKTAQAKSGHALMSEELTLAGILAVTVVGLDEIPGAARHLSWPVKIALGRLRKDLRRIPMLKDADPEFIAHLKVQVVGDIMRPIKRVPMIVDLLVNADLAAEGLEHVTTTGLEDHMVLAMRPEVALQVTQNLIDLLERVKGGDPRISERPGWDPKVFVETVDRVTRKALVRLASEDQASSHHLLLSAHQKGLIEIQDLPEGVRLMIRGAELADRILEAPERFYNEFLQADRLATYRRHASVVKMALPELVKRKEVRPISAILAILHRHLTEPNPKFPERQELAKELLKAFEEQGHVDRMVALALNIPKEERGGLVKGLLLFGESIVPALLFHLLHSEDAYIRRAALSILEQVGPPCIRLVTIELRSHRHPWYAVRNLIGLLGSVARPKDKDAVRAIEEYRDHPKEEVREACLQALARIFGSLAGPYIAPFLDDPSLTVAKRAIFLASSIRYSDPAFLRKLLGFATAQEKDTERVEGLKIAALSALASYGPDILVVVPEVESVLHSLVAPPGLLRRLLMALRRKKGRRSKNVVVHALEALGSIGSNRSIPLLQKLARSGNKEVKEAAGAALEKIVSRCQGGDLGVSGGKDGSSSPR